MYQVRRDPPRAAHALVWPVTTRSAAVAPGDRDLTVRPPRAVRAGVAPRVSKNEPTKNVTVAIANDVTSTRQSTVVATRSLSCTHRLHATAAPMPAQRKTPH